MHATKWPLIKHKLWKQGELRCIKKRDMLNIQSTAYNLTDTTEKLSEEKISIRKMFHAVFGVS